MPTKLPIPPVSASDRFLVSSFFFSFCTDKQTDRQANDNNTIYLLHTMIETVIRRTMLAVRPFRRIKIDAR